MKISPKVAVIGALVLLAALAVGAHFYMSSRIGMAVATERARQAEAQRAELRDQNAELARVIERADAALERSEKAAAEREKALLARLGAVEVATPTQLVDQGSQLLGVSDITTDGKSVQMSVGTYRLIVFRIVEHEDLVNTQKPQWEADRANYKIEISALKESKANLERQLALSDATAQAFKGIISKQRAASMLEKAMWFGIGFAGGVISEKIR